MIAMVGRRTAGTPASHPTRLPPIYLKLSTGRIFGATQIILGTNHPTTRTVKLLPYADHTYEDANRAYNAIIRRVARSKNVLLADAETAFDDVVREGRFSYDDLVLEDQLHLSRFGHDIYLTNRLPILLQAVESVSFGNASVRRAAPMMLAGYRSIQ